MFDFLKNIKLPNIFKKGSNDDPPYIVEYDKDGIPELKMFFNIKDAPQWLQNLIPKKKK